MKNKKNLYITLSPYTKYIEEIDFLAGKLSDNINIFVVYTDLLKNDFEKGKKYNFKLFHINNINALIKKNTDNNIFLRYGRWYFDYITYFLKDKNLLLHSDGIGYILGNKIYQIDIVEKNSISYFKILILYFKLYGILNTFISLFRNRILSNKTDNYGVHKNYGVLELSKIYHTNIENNMLEKKQILIIEQPFIKKLDKDRLKLFFNFIDELVEKNIGYTIVFKIHPRSDINFYKKNITSKSIIFEKGDILSFIKESKYILGFFSTALFSSLLFDKKVIVIDPINLFKNINDFELLKYKNTSYILKSIKLDNISFENKGKEKKVEELLFNFEKFENDLYKL